MGYPQLIVYRKESDEMIILGWILLIIVVGVALYFHDKYRKPEKSK